MHNNSGHRSPERFPNKYSTITAKKSELLRGCAILAKSCEEKRKAILIILMFPARKRVPKRHEGNFAFGMTGT